ncbi:MAG: hypothetical protein JW973_06395 [Bacteroidales bacterium]|nr:hypothetical protein [Bacteroidales bacterium]
MKEVILLSPATLAGLWCFLCTRYPLEQGTTYYARACVTNSAGTGYDREVSFTTRGPDLVVTETVAKDGGVLTIPVLLVKVYTEKGRIIKRIN